MSKKLTEILEEIIYEYDLSYEPIHSEAVHRAILILKESELDEEWTEEDALQLRKIYGRD